MGHHPPICHRSCADLFCWRASGRPPWFRHVSTHCVARWMVHHCDNQLNSSGIRGFHFGGVDIRHLSGGKLVLALDDSIRLALSNNTDIRLDHSQIDFAQNNLGRAHSPFDPLATSSFADTRAKSLTTSTLQGAAILSDLTQTTQLSYKETFLTGTNFQTAFNASKFSTNSSFNTVNPALATTVQFTVSQPLLRNFGLFPNRAPILIAQRNLKQARANFTSQVNNIILAIIPDY